MRKLKETLAMILACTVTVCAIPVYGEVWLPGPDAIQFYDDADPEEETCEEYGPGMDMEKALGFVPGEVIVCVAGGAEMLAEDMASGETADASILGASGTGMAEAAEAVSLFTCSLTAREAAMETGGVSAEGSAEALLGASSLEEAPSEILLLTCEEGKERETISMLQRLPHVEFAELNRVHEFADTGDSSRFITSPSAWKEQWAYNGTSAYGMGTKGTPLWEDDRTKDPVNPETSEYDKDQIVVALLDTGVDYNNPEIAGSLWNCPEDLQKTLGCGPYGWDAVAASTGDGDPTDPFDVLVGHGTHCAGIIGASWKDAAGIYGIANNVKVMAVKIGSASIKDSDALAAFAFVKKAVEAGVNVVACSNSWGGSYHGHAIERASLELGKLGTLTVFAAGNAAKNTDYSSDTVSTVTSNPYFLSVNAHNAEGELSSFSNYGLKSTHVSAPGEKIYSAAAAVLGSIVPNDTETYVPVQDASTEKPYKASFSEVTIASDSEYHEYYADENAFSFTGAHLATASSVDVKAHEGANVYLVSESTVPEDEPPFAELIVDLSEADLSSENGLYFGFRLTAAGWIPGRTNPDIGRLTVAAVHADGMTNDLFDQQYQIVHGDPITVSVPADPAADHYRIRLYAARWNSSEEAYLYIDPEFAAFDDFLFTKKCSAYKSLSGTSMACPAVSGEAAVLAAEFSLLPSETRAKELKARIIGSAVPFKNEADRDKNLSGGYANLVKAVEEDYAPVVEEASFDKETGLLTLHGYFFPNAERAAREGWSVLLDETRITEVTWAEDGRSAALSMGNADAGTKEYAIRMMAMSSEKSGRCYLTIDTGKPASGLMERIDLAGTPEEMFMGEYAGMVPLDGKLYLLQYADNADAKKVGFVVWSWDTAVGGAWKRLNETPVNAEFFGDPSLDLRSCSDLMAYQGKLVFALDFEKPESGEFITYLVFLNQTTGAVTYAPAAAENYETSSRGLCVLSLGEKLLLMRPALTGSGESGDIEFSLYTLSEGGAPVRKATHLLTDTTFLGSLIYQDDGTFLMNGLLKGPEDREDGLMRWRVTEEAVSHEFLTDADITVTGDVKEKDSQSDLCRTSPLQDALISTGILNTEGNDTYILKGLSGAGTVSADPLSADSAKLLNLAAAATSGKYYVLGQTRNGGTGRSVFCVQDLSTLGLSTIKDPGDVEKPDPPQPDPDPPYPDPVPYHGGSGGGGGSAKKEALTYSQFWVQENGVWKVKDRAGKPVVNAWLCDDAVMGNGQNVWYLLKADGTMASDGLLMDASGNFYSLETEHNGYFGSLRYKDGYYDVGGRRIYLSFCHDHNGAFGAVTSPEGLEILKSVYGVTQYANGNESITYTSKF